MGDRPYAVVDGRIVRLGDPLAKGKVARIDATGVWIGVPGAGRASPSMRHIKWLPNVAKTPTQVAKTPLLGRTEKK